MGLSEKRIDKVQAEFEFSFGARESVGSNLLRSAEFKTKTRLTEAKMIDSGCFSFWTMLVASRSKEIKVS